MTQSEPLNAVPTAAADATAAPTSVAKPEGQPLEPATTGITAHQADAILAELKSIKQNLFWLLLIAGFFAARSFFFHY